MDKAGDSQLWLMISSDWLYRWKCFVSNKVSKNIGGRSLDEQTLRKSENDKIGIMPPGPISNDCLFEKISPLSAKSGETRILKSGLVLNKEYRGVNREVWSIFHRMYGGGPVIVRGELDIYSRDLSEELHKKASSKPHKKGGNANIFAHGSKNLAQSAAQ
jgi:hypothetical protein